MTQPCACIAEEWATIGVPTSCMSTLGGRPPCHEIVFEDPILGVLPLDDTFPIEVWRFKGPVARQRWEPTDVRRLYSELILSGAIDIVGAGEGEKMTG